MVISMLSALFFLLALYSAYARRLWSLVTFGGFALSFKVWFLEHMVVCYEEHLARPWWGRLLRF
jgi:hypothetical protein